MMNQELQEHLAQSGDYLLGECAMCGGKEVEINTESKLCDDCYQNSGYCQICDTYFQDKPGCNHIRWFGEGWHGCGYDGLDTDTQAQLAYFLEKMEVLEPYPGTFAKDLIEFLRSGDYEFKEGLPCDCRLGKKHYGTYVTTFIEKEMEAHPNENYEDIKILRGWDYLCTLDGDKAYVRKCANRVADWIEDYLKGGSSCRAYWRVYRENYSCFTPILYHKVRKYSNAQLCAGAILSENDLITADIRCIIEALPYAYADPDLY